MTENIYLWVAFLLGYMTFVFYTNSTMRPRKSYIAANMITTAGYMALYVIALKGNPQWNAFSFTAINFLIIYLCFKTNVKNAIIQALILTAILMFSEGILSLFTDVSSEVNSFYGKSMGVKMTHAILSKLIYFIGVLTVKFISKDKEKYEEYNGFFYLLIIPLFTILSISAIMSVFNNINEEQRIKFALVAGVGVAANIIVYWIYDKTLVYQKEIKKLQEQQFKENLELMYCNMLEEKLSQTKIMRHDFREHLKILDTYIDSSNTAAKQYLKSIEIKNDAINIINYTNNKVLDIILSEKRRACVENGIDLQLNISEADLGFMKDIDIVSVFSNLLNNAIEGSMKSSKKVIRVNLHIMNNAFMVIKIENSCDEKPIIENGFYKTTKLSHGEHGIGLRSVAKTIKEYDGDLMLEYNDGEKMFLSLILIPLV